MNIRLLVGSLAMLVCLGSHAAENADFERLQGVWQATIMEVDPEAGLGNVEVDPEAGLGNVRIVFERDLATLYQDGQRVGSSRFTLDSEKPLHEKFERSWTPRGAMSPCIPMAS